MNIVSNPVASIINANYIGILAWTVLFGIGLRGAKEETKKMFDDISMAFQSCYLDRQLCTCLVLWDWYLTRYLPTDFPFLPNMETVAGTGRIHAVYLFCSAIRFWYSGVSVRIRFRLFSDA